jgi:hypothetical protein
MRNQPPKFYIIGSLLLVGLILAISLIVIGIRQMGSGPTTTGNGKANGSGTSITIPPVPGGKALYVSPSGNDNNDGSATHPLATIQKAADQVKPGTTVHVQPGTYTDAVLVETDGTKDSRITFVSDKK